jgi:transcriptional regulator with XRE-family HTH domain
MKLPRLREWRESRGFTQRELASRADVGEKVVPRAEAGESIRPNTARKLAGALDIEVVDLMERPPVPLAQAPSASPETATGAKPPETIVHLGPQELRLSQGELRVEVRERLERALQLVDAGQMEAAAEEVEEARRILAAA